MARPVNKEPLPAHPAVGLKFRYIHYPNTPKGVKRLSAKVTCPTCEKSRWYRVGTLRQQLKRSNYTGNCLRCSQKLTRTGYYKWALRNGRIRREKTTAGYIVLGPTAIDLVDLPLFRAMQNKNRGVFEHRMVMAKKLGRPLRSNECVDHQDGNRDNNALHNLRLYIRGKNQPGSVGYGTYYHEWQMAEAEIKRLKKSIATMRSNRQNRNRQTKRRVKH